MPAAVTDAAGELTPAKPFCALGGELVSSGNPDISGALWTGYGTTWTRTVVGSDLESIEAVSCISRVFCAAGGSGILATFDGSSWTTQDTALEWVSVSCTSVTFCVALGQDGVGVDATVYNGSTWTSPLRLGSDTDPGEVDCVATNFCVATWTAIVTQGDAYTDIAHASVYSGASWQSSQLPIVAPYTSSLLSSLSCTSTTFCVAFGDDWSQGSAGACVIGYCLTAEAYSVYDGEGWRSRIIMREPNTSELNWGQAISCTSSAFCLASGYDTYNAEGANFDDTFVSFFNGATWRNQNLGEVDNSEHVLEVSSVSCATSQFCALAGGGLAEFYDGKSFTLVVAHPDDAFGSAANCVAQEVEYSDSKTVKFAPLCAAVAFDGGNDGAVAVHTSTQVSLGDSFSAGEGAVDSTASTHPNSSFYAGTDVWSSASKVTNVCHRSKYAYGPQIATSLGYSFSASEDFLACSGATLANFWGTQSFCSKCGAVPAQLNDLRTMTGGAPDGNIGLVTFTVGGNFTVNAKTAGFSAILDACIEGSNAFVKLLKKVDTTLCSQTGIQARVQQGLRYLAGNGDSAESLLQTIKAIHALAPNALILVGGYPHLFGPGGSGTCTVGSLGALGNLDIPRRAFPWLNAAVNSVDSYISSTVAMSGVAKFVDPRSDFADHGNCDSSTSYFNALYPVISESPDPFLWSFHPTVMGQRQYANAFEEALVPPA